MQNGLVSHSGKSGLGRCTTVVRSTKAWLWSDCRFWFYEDVMPKNTLITRGAF